MNKLVNQFKFTLLYYIISIVLILLLYYFFAVVLSIVIVIFTNTDLFDLLSKFLIIDFDKIILLFNPALMILIIYLHSFYKQNIITKIETFQNLIFLSIYYLILWFIIIFL